MVIDITHLDKTLLIQALFAFANPAGLGKAEFLFRKIKGDNVDGLTEAECELILSQVENIEYTHVQLIDYLKGKPIKLNFYRKKNGRILVETSSYDSRNGKYRFLEALLNFFPLDEIYITRKTFEPYTFTNIPEHLLRSKEQLSLFKTLLNNTIQKENNLGKYSIIDQSKVNYISPILKDLQELLNNDN